MLTINALLILNLILQTLRYIITANYKTIIINVYILHSLNIQYW